MMTTRWARVLRGQFVAVFATFAAAFSHGAADGAHPPLFSVALALAFSGLASIALMGRRMQRLGLAAAIGVSQALYHGLFSLFGVAGSSPSTAIVGGGIHAHHAPIVFAPTTTTGSTVAVSGDAVMVVAHATAAVLTFAVVVYSGRLCAAVAAVTRLVVASLAWLQARVVRPVSVRVRLPHGARIALPHRSLILDSRLRHRGPPATLRFA